MQMTKYENENKVLAEYNKGFKSDLEAKDQQIKLLFSDIEKQKKEMKKVSSYAN